MAEPKLCPDCPLRPFLSDIKPESYTRTPTEQTNVKACSKLRALAAKWGWPTCPYFPRLENITIWSGKSCVNALVNSGRK